MNEESSGSTSCCCCCIPIPRTIGKDSQCRKRIRRYLNKLDGPDAVRRRSLDDGRIYPEPLVPQIEIPQETENESKASGVDSRASILTSSISSSLSNIPDRDISSKPDNHYQPKTPKQKLNTLLQTGNLSEKNETNVPDDVESFDKNRDNKTRRSSLQHLAHHAKHGENHSHVNFNTPETNEEPHEPFKGTFQLLMELNKKWYVVVYNLLKSFFGWL